MSASKPVESRLESSIFNYFVQNPGRRQIKESDGFAQRLLIRPPEHRATKKPLFAGYREGGHNSTLKTVNVVLPHHLLIITSVGWDWRWAGVEGMGEISIC